jgi:hypothetical protein
MRQLDQTIFPTYLGTSVFRKVKHPAKWRKGLWGMKAGNE